MKLKLLVARAGVDFSQHRGDIIDVPSGEGQRMIDAGQAELVRDEPVERAVPKSRVEKAVK